MLKPLSSPPDWGRRPHLSSVPTHLVIVESPAKAKTIKRFLGKDFLVEASMGHVRDLPEGSLGVDVDDAFAPQYEVPEEKQSVVKNLKKALKEADDLWIATDEDREGEAIGWHLVQVLGGKKLGAIRRIVFHEITESAIKEAAAHPREIDMRLVDAQQARRILDRLVGYTLSPFLWKKVMSGLSAGRVQSVAVRIIVDREREIQAFIPQEYWTIAAELTTPKGEAFTAELQRYGEKKCEVRSESEAKHVLKDLDGASFSVASLEEKDVRRSPPAPFTTSTLQQEASRKLGFSVKQTMVVAQQLYEGVSLGKGDGHTGLITYMRTDSVNLSEKALADCKETIGKLYGREYVLAESRTYKTKAKGAQEAHEAIRPTEISRTPESLADVLDHQQLKLYTLIWNRTMATQMPAAEFKRVGADIDANGYVFRATGQTVTFDGFLRVYSEGRDEPVDHRQNPEEDEGEKRLPPLKEGEKLGLQQIVPEQHFTKPPPRYTEASLVKKLEEEGIGRPSTYAPTISTVQQRGYVMKESNRLIPSAVAFTVVDLLTEHFPSIVDLGFTAQMEQSLDDIAEGGKHGTDFLRDFYKPFKQLVDVKTKEIRKEDVMKERLLGKDPATGQSVYARMGRFGPYVQLGEAKDAEGKRKTDARTASLPKNALLESVMLDEALALLAFPKTLGRHGGEDVTIQFGRFGPYIRCGKQTTTVPKDADPTTITLMQAVQMMAEATERKKRAAEPLRVLGSDPATGAEMLIKDGRYGPYITDGKTNASLPKKFDPQTVTVEEAAELLAKKRAAGPGKRVWRGKKKGA
ncbi:MAG: DNA topoisomerase I [Candidatus Peregrinibacteria bacterium Gr01-1014_25]|nr:MAG: DNA topoisomerase I [Candidatus Peregrinibacteria bacterium Gr01-1014_25]